MDQTQADESSKLTPEFMQWYEEFKKEASSNTAVIDEVIQSEQRSMQELPDEDPRRRYHLYTISALHELKYRKHRKMVDLKKAIVASREAVLMAAKHWDIENLWHYIWSLAKIYITVVEDLDMSDEYARAMTELRTAAKEASELEGASETEQFRHLAAVGFVFMKRFNELHLMDAIDLAISTQDSSITDIPELHIDPNDIFGLSISRKGQALMHKNELDNSIEKLRQSPEYAIGHSGRAECLWGIAVLLTSRYRSFNDVKDLNDAIDNYDLAEACCTDEVFLPKLLSSYGSALWRRYGLTADETDIEKSILLHQRAVELTPIGDEARPKRLTTLSTSYIAQYVNLGHSVSANLHHSVCASREAVKLAKPGHDYRAPSLATLGAALKSKYHEDWEISDINESIEVQEEALTLTKPNDPDYTRFASTLGSTYSTRYERTHERSDISKSISWQREAINHIREGDSDKAIYLSNIGVALSMRFSLAQSQADIDEAITNMEEAVSILNNEHPSKALILCQLGDAYRARGDHFEIGTDIDKAVKSHQTAVIIASSTMPEAHLLRYQLASSLIYRHFRDRTKGVLNLDDLSFAILIAEDALIVNGTGPPFKYDIMRLIGGMHNVRYGILGLSDDWDQACKYLQASIDAIPPTEEQEKMHSLILLSNTLLSKFRTRGVAAERDAVNAGIEKAEEAMKLLPKSHPSRASYSTFVADLHLFRYDKFHDERDLDNSLDLYHVAMLQSIGETRFSASTNLARAAHKYNRIELALEGYTTAINTLPTMVWLGLQPEARISRLTEHSKGLASDAAACALELGNSKLAIELLAKAGSILWSQATNLHIDPPILTELQNLNPELAKEITNVGKALQKHNWQQLDPTNLSDSGGISILTSKRGVLHRTGNNPEEASQVYRQLVRKWEKLVATIDQQLEANGSQKSSPVFTMQQFLQESRHRDPNHCTFESMAVVIINVSQFSVNAIILGDHSEPAIVPLPNIDITTLSDLSSAILENRPSLDATPDERKYYTRRYLRPALKRVWKDIIIPIFTHLEISTKYSCSTEPPKHRIWWYPTGPLAFIPIHAAGPYDKVNAVDVSRLVVSSYVTNISTLAHPKPVTSDAPQNLTPKILLVGQSNTEGQSALPRASEEVERVAKSIVAALGSEDSIIRLEGDNATVKEVSTALSGAPVAHFTCHGVQDYDLGMRSGVLLHDGKLQVSELASKETLSRQLAFLSVCHGASGVQDLPGEAMHLAAAFQFVGFPSVIATMWGIMDQDAPEVAEFVYQYLLRNGRQWIDHNEAALALNNAVAALRKRKEVTLDRWSSFIHIGV